jgi:o-succinylbenzoate---CoA ligase
VRELVAIDLPGGPAFVAALRRAWDDGDAVVPVDPRLPAPARQALLRATRPHVLVASAHGSDPSGASGVERVPLDPSAPTVAGSDALVVATSGTTGLPKAVVHTHAALAAHAAAVHDRLGVDPDRDRWLACLPLAHLGGLGVVIRSVVTGTPVDVWPAFDADAAAAAPRRLGSTLVSLVPTALDRIDPSGFRWVVLGGAADATVRPANVVHTYGLTETGGGVVYDGLPLAGIEVRVGDDGAVALRGPTLARGIRRIDGTVDDRTDDDGWLVTGDLGRWATGTDGTARLEVLGRADDLIVTGGENVWPSAVEAVLATHPSVAEVAVAGRPDPEWGQRVVAVVVARPDGPSPALEALRDHVRGHLPASAAPREVLVVAGLPRTALGKIRRADLPIR